MTPLLDRIRALVAAEGPIPVADYMALALGDPACGYYATREPFGPSGDFVTAPEVSQMFGELVGIWCVAAHAAMGAPDRFVLAELGPGRGTLMADLLRAAGIRPGFRGGAAVHLVETSRRLRAVQAETLRGRADPIWHDRIDDLPDGPAIILANEFFDALPVRQFVRTASGWRERVVGLAANGRLAFGAGTAVPGPDLLPPGADAAPIGTIFEVNRPAEGVMAALADRVRRQGGAVLAFDYGSLAPGFGDTLQALGRHAHADPLAAPGTVDLTTHVDFSALAAAARTAGARVHGPVTQGAFLLAIGLLERAGRLGATRGEADRAALVAAVERLAGPDAMGTLFKVIGVSSGLDLPGFG